MEMLSKWSSVAIVFFLVGCAMLPKKVQKEVVLDPIALEKIDEITNGLVEDGFTPGAVVLVGIDDKILMRKAYGNRLSDSDEPMTEDTLFDLASVTKATSTASAIMLLVQEGKLSVDDPVAKYIPEFAENGKEKLTIRSLLTHCSGLPSYTSASKLEERFGPRPNPQGLIQQISELKLNGVVGENYVYSCLNYLVLARIAQKVSGQNMSDYLRERMWKPLGMNDTTYYPTEEQVARTAPTLRNGEGIRRGMVHDPLANYSVCEEYASGNAGAFSTVDDLSRYARMILNGGKLGRKRIFKPEIWETITTNQSPDTIRTKRSFGWGLWTDDCYATPLNEEPENAVLGHTGYTGTIIWMDKLSKAYFIMLTNCVYPDDKPQNKEAVMAGRREAIKTVVDNLSIYRGVRGKERE